MIERHTSDGTRTTILVDLTGDCFQIAATHTYAALVVTGLKAFVPHTELFKFVMICGVKSQRFLLGSLLLW